MLRPTVNHSLETLFRDNPKNVVALENNRCSKGCGHTLFEDSVFSMDADNRTLNFSCQLFCSFLPATTRVVLALEHLPQLSSFALQIFHPLFPAQFVSFLLRYISSSSEHLTFFSFLLNSLPPSRASSPVSSLSHPHLLSSQSNTTFSHINSQGANTFKLL